ncbi:hypothetical protein [Kurthia massiliensis]|uniref:hypothetical protein n=1 Tax=Kurthia massiliensis TaxID=1033739 RepID=UPI0002893377|nr:hypothetical protein [Kurthia massiliensis]
MITALMLVAGIVLGITEYWVVGKFLAQDVPQKSAFFINLSFLLAGVAFIALGSLDLGVNFILYLGVPIVLFGIISIIRVLGTKKEDLR